MRTRVCLLLALCAACGDNQDPAAAEALWQRIHDEGYRSFARAPGFETTQPSNTAHSDQVDIYVNEVLVEALASGPLEAWPVGSLIVKDGFDDDGELQLVAVLDKRDDGWFFAEYDDPESGDALYSGQPDVCLGCHTSANDHVNAFALPK